MNELKEMLMEQLRLLQEHSKHGCCMAHIAEVLVQIK